MKLIRSPIMSGMGEAMLLAASALRLSDTNRTIAAAMAYARRFLRTASPVGGL